MDVADERDKATALAQRLNEGIPANPYALPVLLLEEREGYPFGGDWMSIVVSRFQSTQEDSE